jgi:predicted small lipoprotein YifL
VTAEDLLGLAPRFRAAALTALVALSASGCGRYGPLEPPPDANAPKPTPTAAQDASGSGMGSLGKPKNPPITPPNQSFVLDPLLK